MLRCQRIANERASLGDEEPVLFMDDYGVFWAYIGGIGIAPHWTAHIGVVGCIGRIGYDIGSIG